METAKTERIEYIHDPYFPKGKVVGAYGRGGTAKSSLLAALLVRISKKFSSLWVSSEEPADWIMTRHIKNEGKPGTLVVPTVIVRDDQRDKDGRPFASSFGVFEDLEQVIIQSIALLKENGSPPLGVVALDAIVALVDWKASEQPNNDANVKRVIFYLESLAQKYDVTIWMIGHANKQQGKGINAELSDGVMGARAWVDSPRLSFMHFEDKHDENAFVVYSIKTNLGAFFAQDYKTKPVHILFQREGHNDSVLCGVDFGEIIWGRNEGRERVVEAITIDEENANTERINRKKAIVDSIVAAVLEQIKATGSATRKQVESTLGGEEFSRRYWQDADAILSTVFNVRMQSGAHGALTYCGRKE